jgi:hypothetical protein
MDAVGGTLDLALPLDRVAVGVDHDQVVRADFEPVQAEGMGQEAVPGTMQVKWLSMPSWKSNLTAQRKAAAKSMRACRMSSLIAVAPPIRSYCASGANVNAGSSLYRKRKFLAQTSEKIVEPAPVLH